MIRTIDSLALLGLGAVIHASLVGGGVINCAPGLSAFLSEGADKALLLSDVAGNLIAYALLAALLVAGRYARMCARTGSRPVNPLHLLLGILLACSVLSLGIEAVQACLPGRLSSIWDWLFNTLGALAGIGLMRLVSRKRPEDLSDPGDRTVSQTTVSRELALMGALAWAMFASSPWAVSDAGLALAKWRGLQTTWALSGIDPSRLASTVLQSLSVGLLLGLPRMDHAMKIACALGLMTIVLLAELLLMRPIPILETWLGVPAGLTAGLLMSASLTMGQELDQAHRRRLVGVLLAASTCAALAWWSTRASPGALKPFSWGIRGLAGDALEGIRLLGLASWVAISLMVSGACIGGPRPLWGLIALVVLAVSEALHTFTPGRPGDLTGPVFGLAGVLLASLMLSAKPSGLQSRASRLV